jgi:hypothetical protein
MPLRSPSIPVPRAQSPSGIGRTGLVAGLNSLPRGLVDNSQHAREGLAAASAGQNAWLKDFPDERYVGYWTE